jgi:hypothetical protein
MEQWWQDTDSINPQYSEKTLLKAIASTAKPTRTLLGSNQGLCGEGAAIKVLTHGTAFNE